MKRIMILLAVMAIMVCCGGSDEEKDAAAAEFAGDDVAAVDTPVVMHRLKVRPVSSYSRTFNDVNAEHLAVARAIGIKPISSLYDAYNLRKPIMRINTCNDFHVDELTHSVPYLVPEATRLLHDIGRSFSDTVMARGGKKYKIRVTSVTRTDHTVAMLRRGGNVNATSESAHRYGTTFDVSYIRFMCCDSSFMVAPQDLRGILAEVLADYRDKGRCLVKYELKQGCFHITAR
ncbi:MAG TPA: hypothetical protein IAA88_07270 [Candidatus Avimuribaculum pullicola]|nr:hypothetical protein [Candidatus Avimuribaculum pullicola]